MGIFITLSLCYLRHSKDRGINRGQGSSDLPTSEKIASTLPPQGAAHRWASCEDVLAHTSQVALLGLGQNCR